MRLTAPRPAPFGLTGRPSGPLARFTGLYMGWVNAGMIDVAIDRLVPFPGERILEIGFGSGDAIARLAEIPGIGQIAGVDHSHAMVAQATDWNWAAIDAGRVELRHGAVAALPFADRCFDAAVAINSVHYWAQPTADLNDIRRVLRPGGRLLLAIRLGRYERQAGWPNFIVQALEDAGFGRIVSERVVTKPTPCVVVRARRP
jgi:SAM-dependent methyltransferase